MHFVLYDCVEYCYWLSIVLMHVAGLVNVVFVSLVRVRSGLGVTLIMRSSIVKIRLGVISFTDYCCLRGLGALRGLLALLVLLVGLGLELCGAF